MTYPFLATPDIGVFTDIMPDMVPISRSISEYTDVGSKKTRCRSRCVCNITIYRCRVLPMSGFLRYRGRHITCSGCTSAARPDAPTGQASWSSDELCRPKGQCLGYCLHPSAQHATAEKGQGLGWCPADRLELENLTWKLELSIFKL